MLSHGYLKNRFDSALLALEAGINPKRMTPD